MEMKLYTDGGARGNPGPAAAGAVLVNNDKEEVKKLGAYLGRCTNNEAEYRALILGINAAIDEKVNDLTCYSDSELVVKQLNGEYKVKNGNLRKFWDQIKVLERSFDSIEYIHVKRRINKTADRLVNEVLDAEKNN